MTNRFTKCLSHSIFYTLKKTNKKKNTRQGIKFQWHNLTGTQIYKDAEH